MLLILFTGILKNYHTAKILQSRIHCFLNKFIKIAINTIEKTAVKNELDKNLKIADLLIKLQLPSGVNDSSLLAIHDKVKLILPYFCFVTELFQRKIVGNTD